MLRISLDFDLLPAHVLKSLDAEFYTSHSSLNCTFLPFTTLRLKCQLETMSPESISEAAM